MTNEPAALSLQRGPASHPAAEPGAVRPVVARSRTTTLSIPGSLPQKAGVPAEVKDLIQSLHQGSSALPASQIPPESADYVSLRRGKTEPFAGQADAPPLTATASTQSLASGEQPATVMELFETVREDLQKGLMKGLETFSQNAKTQWHKIKNTKGYQNLTEYIKSNHPKVSLIAGFVIPAAIGVFSPELAGQLMAHYGEVRTVAGLTALATGALETMLDREKSYGKACRWLRIAASDVLIATSIAPLGGMAGNFLHEAMPNISHLLHPPAEVASTATPTVASTPSPDHPKPVATSTEPAAATSTPHATATEAPPTATPEIQPTWQPGHLPTTEQLHYADTNNHVTLVDVNKDGINDFRVYDLAGDAKPDAFVHIKTGQVWMHMPDGQWAVDTDGNGIPDQWYSQPPVPDTSGVHGGKYGLAAIRPEIAQGGVSPLPESLDKTGDGKPDLFRQENDWYLDLNGDGKLDPSEIVKVDGFVDNGGVWDSGNLHITSSDGSLEWKFDGTNWVSSHLTTPLQSAVQVLPDKVTIQQGQGKWHAGSNYVDSIISTDAAKADSSLTSNFAPGTGAHDIATDAVKDVLASHNVNTNMSDPNNLTVQIDPSLRPEIAHRIQHTVDTINSWFTPGMTDDQKNEFLASLSQRGLLSVKNLSLDQLNALQKLANGLK